MAQRPTRRPRIVKAPSAHEMAARHRDISVAEFFQKNRHLLGFDSPRKALLTAVKEAVDNSLDACEEAGLLPDIEVRVDVAGNGAAPPPSQADRFIIHVTDNGPGIPKKKVGKVFAKLLYGSKFHRLRMSRGQQGIGISAAGMYGQLTTGKPTRVKTKIKGERKAHLLEISIDAKKNEPVEHESAQEEWEPEHGTCVSIELEGRYQRGRASVEEYLELCAIANPHMKLTYVPPDAPARVFPRGVAELPKAPREIKPHPLGIELGMLIKMAQDTKSHWLSAFLNSEFVRVSPRVAEEVCAKAKLKPRMRPKELIGDNAEALYRTIQNTKFMSPPTDCLSPIGEKAILAGLVKTIKADFYTAVTRPPKVYRGNPFVIECGIAFGKGKGAPAKSAEELAEEHREKVKNGEMEARAEGEKDDEKGEMARVIRFANRVPLVYQQSACAMYQSVLKTAWRNYGLSQSRGSLPQGPLVVFIHMASVWVPFTSEAKEAIAGYDEIIEEAKRSLQECGRKLGKWLRKREHAKSEFQRRHTFQRYIEEVADACKRIKGGRLDTLKLKKQLTKIAERVTGGEATTRILENKPYELEHVVERTEEGLTGDVPVLLTEEGCQALEAGAPLPEQPAPEPVETPELIKGATKDKRKKVDLTKPAKRKKKGKAKANAKGKRGRKNRREKTLFD